MTGEPRYAVLITTVYLLDVPTLKTRTRTAIDALLSGRSIGHTTRTRLSRYAIPSASAWAA